MGLSVLVMLTIALIAGQARANLHGQATADAGFELTAQVSASSHSERLRKLESLARIIDTMFTVPSEIEATFLELRRELRLDVHDGDDACSVDGTFE